jgi:hypothetical protein
VWDAVRPEAECFLTISVARARWTAIRAASMRQRVFKGDYKIDAPADNPHYRAMMVSAVRPVRSAMVVSTRLACSSSTRSTTNSVSVSV